MSSPLISVGLPVALALVMFGLGLSLTVADFARVTRQPRAVVAALGTQIVLIPLACFGLVVGVGLDPVLAVGMMLLAAAPGGTSANLFSHLFRGDVALNITLTAVNSILAVLTLPLVVNLSLAYFRSGVSGVVGLDLSKTAQVFAVVLVPVAVGMVVRRASASFAARADRTVRILSVLVLASVITGVLISQWAILADNLAEIGLIATVFCLVNLGAGYLLPRLLDVGHPQAVASAFEIGIHNSGLAITVAISVLGDPLLAVPAAVYGTVIFPLAVGAGFLLRRLAPRPDDDLAGGPRPIQAPA